MLYITSLTSCPVFPICEHKFGENAYSLKVNFGVVMQFDSSSSIVQRVSLHEKIDADFKIFMKRDDLVHPLYGGNKFRKLKHNLRQLETAGKSGILTFGGPWSNHLAATAAVCNEHKIRCIGIVRGYASAEPTKTLLDATAAGMELQFRSPAEYDQMKHTAESGELDPEMFIIPEGGANSDGALGCQDIVREIDFNFDVIACPCGSGTTISGIASAIVGHQQAVGYPVMKGGSYLEDEIRRLLIELQASESNWSLSADYHFGGFAKVDEELIEFMRHFYRGNQIKLDPVYSAKMCLGVLKDIEKGRFAAGSKIVLVHTGGLQGLTGIEAKLGYNIYHE